MLSVLFGQAQAHIMEEISIFLPESICLKLDSPSIMALGMELEVYFASMRVQLESQELERPNSSRECASQTSQAITTPANSESE